MCVLKHLEYIIILEVRTYKLLRWLCVLYIVLNLLAIYIITSNYDIKSEKIRTKKK